MKELLINSLRAVIKFFYRKQVWLFSSWDAQLYSDNPKYLFEYVNANKKPVLAIWITNNKTLYRELKKAGIKTVLVNKYTKFFMFCIADCFFFSDNYTPLKKKRTKKILYVNLWHGMPIKQIGDIGNRSDYFIATNPSSQQILSRAASLPTDKVLVLGQPKNDGLFTQKSLRKKLKLPDDARIITYMPTYRGSFLSSPTGRDNDTGIFLDESLKDNPEFNRFTTVLETFNAYFIIKPHIRNTFGSNLHERIIILDEFTSLVPEIDNYEILGNTDVLVSDFSSLILDFFMLDRPVIFYAPDWIAYCKEYQLNYDYGFLTRGNIATDITALVDSIRESLSGDDRHKPGAALKAFFNTYTDAHHAERVFDFFYNFIGNKNRVT